MTKLMTLFRDIDNWLLNYIIYDPLNLGPINTEYWWVRVLIQWHYVDIYLVWLLGSYLLD